MTRESQSFDYLFQASADQSSVASERLVPKGITGIVVCTTEGSHKWDHARAAIAETDFANLPVARFAPNQVPEEEFHEGLSARPDLIAALKVAQRPSDLRAMIWHVFPSSQSTDVLSGPVAFLATDILVDLQNEQGRWQHYNKPTNLSEAELIGQLVRILVSDTEIPVRLRMGAAVYCVDPRGKSGSTSGRGVAGMVETFFTVSPLSAADFGQYLQNNPLEKLYKANLGMYWGDPTISRHITAIGGIPSAERGVEQLQKQLRGWVPGMDDLLTYANAFQMSKARGELTGDLRSALPPGWDIPIGSWGTWRPKIEQ